MVDMTAITSAAGDLKAAYDLSKTAISVHDAAAIRAKVAEMQGEISSASPLMRTPNPSFMRIDCLKNIPRPR